MHIIFLKLSLLCAYIVASQCDILCLSETVLDSVIISDDVNLDIPGHNLVRADYPANAKRGGVCLYFRKSLPLRIFHIHFFNECINFEIKIGDKVCSFISLYGSPNQSLKEFDTFAVNFELN